MVKKMEDEKTVIINDFCTDRIKPKLIRDVKTEAVLVFARTALERFFAKFDKGELALFIDTHEVDDLYNTLRALLGDMKDCVVNAEYLIDLIQSAKRHPSSLELKRIAKFEEPLIMFYDTMAKRIVHHFPHKKDALPEFLVVCVMSNWFLEEEKSAVLYPFIKNYDFIKLTDEFEKHAMGMREDRKRVFLGMQKVSIDVIASLKKAKYKMNTQRKSKTRKKRK